MLNRIEEAQRPTQAAPATRIVIDADPWLRRLDLPYCTLAILRELRVGDVVVLFDYDGPGIISGGVPGHAAASIERCKGGQWRFDALWLLHVGHARQRGHILTSGKFQVETGRRLSWDPHDAAAMRGFERIVHLSRCLALMARAAGDRASSVRLQPYPRRNQDFAWTEVPFLDTIAAAPLGTLGKGHAHEQ